MKADDHKKSTLLSENESDVAMKKYIARLKKVMRVVVSREMACGLGDDAGNALSNYANHGVK